MLYAKPHQLSHAIASPCPIIRWIVLVRQGRWVTHWGRYKLKAILQTTFSLMKMYELLLRLKFVRIENNSPALVQIMSCRLVDANSLSNHWRWVYWLIYASFSLNELSLNCKNHTYLTHDNVPWQPVGGHYGNLPARRSDSLYSCYIMCVFFQYEYHATTLPDFTALLYKSD